MSIAKPFTFVAGQKARANEVNEDFDTLYSQVNINIADIAQINRDIDSIVDTKADIDGNSTQTFAVANPVNSTDAINKQTMQKALTNILDYISGLEITKDSASPDDTILISPGSCYDSTKQVVLELQNITTKQNTNQGANTTYYVYIVGNEAGSSIDIIISNSSVKPAGYTIFRCIGNFSTDRNNKISSISSYTNSSGFGMPDYSRGESRIRNTSYTATQNGWLRSSMSSKADAGGGGNTQSIEVDGVVVASTKIDAFSSSAALTSLTIRNVMIVPIPKGSTYLSSGDGSIIFYPCKGVL